MFPKTYNECDCPKKIAKALNNKTLKSDVASAADYFNSKLRGQATDEEKRAGAILNHYRYEIYKALKSNDRLMLVRQLIIIAKKY